jgi:hypothetical protein
MPLHDLLTGLILYFLIPLWLAAGFGDWLCHRRSNISQTAGLKESLLHLLMLAEIGVPMLAGLFLEINSLVIALMIAGFLAHEATVLWDLNYTIGRRYIGPAEQHMHSFQEIIPLMALCAVVLLHWDQFIALAGVGGKGRYILEWKHHPLPADYLAAILSLTALFVILPFMEEVWRCYRRHGGMPAPPAKG